MAQRISRAKQTIRAAGASFPEPAGVERTRRLGTVLHVLYLIFNEGYTSSTGPNLQREDLANQAIRLARKLHAEVPDETEVAGLLALMLLTHARRAARTGGYGELIPLTRQDRTLWDRDLIAEGVALLTATLPKGAIGPYQLQAAIAALHDEAPGSDDTDWPQILALYGLLERITENPMVKLNRAIAAAMVHGPEAGLVLLDELAQDRRMAGSHRIDAARAHLLERTGDLDGAVAHYRTAAALTTNLAERDYLLARAAEALEQLQERNSTGASETTGANARRVREVPARH